MSTEEPTNNELCEMSKLVLENPFWIPVLQVDEMYCRLHDDTDGERQGEVQVLISEVGDIVITTDRHRGPALRFRTDAGGGRSLRTRNALMLLAYAISLDQKERPD